jgi:small-conductance mechanosensitive channel
MDRLWELLRDNDSVVGRLTTSLVIVVAGLIVAIVVGRLLALRFEDPVSRYYARKLTHYAVAVLTAIALAIAWRPFAGRIGVVIGLATAGIAFAMQEVIGAFAGWVNIMSGRIFRVGDRVQMGGVRGDVIDVTPLRTKIMEMGSPSDNDAWVRGRQYTGRIVAVSNKATFSEPVYNYSAVFDFIWEEIAIPVSYDCDWKQAEAILSEEVGRLARSAEARRALTEMQARYPVPRAELEPRTFVRATDNWVELSARFPISVRTARSVKDELTRTVLDRLEQAGIAIASETRDVRIRTGDGSGEQA